MLKWRSELATIWYVGKNRPFVCFAVCLCSFLFVFQEQLITTLFMCQSDLAPCKDRVLTGDTLYNNYKMLKIH